MADGAAQPGLSVLVSAAIVPLVQTGGAYIVGAVAAAVVTRITGGFTLGLFARHRRPWHWPDGPIFND